MIGVADAATCVAGFFQETISGLSPVHIIAAGSLKTLQSMRGCKETGGNDSERIDIFVHHCGHKRLKLKYT